MNDIDCSIALTLHLVSIDLNKVLWNIIPPGILNEREIQHTQGAIPFSTVKPNTYLNVKKFNNSEDMSGINLFE